MGTADRKISEEETEKNKEARKENRLGDLPEVLQLYILACVDAKLAVQASVLSKNLGSLWTRIPVLKFNCFYSDDFTVFRNLVKTVLCRRDSLGKLDCLKLYAETSCPAQILKSVFEYVCSHGVKKLEASIDSVDSASWPVSICDSLMSLKLRTSKKTRCPFLRPGSIYFKNLTFLYLKGARITDEEPFSGFAVLKSLTLIECYLRIDDGNMKTLRVYAPRLSELTISDCLGIESCMLTTPILRLLKYGGYGVPEHEGLTLLENLVIDCQGFVFPVFLGKESKKQRVDKLLHFFSTFGNLKWLTLSLSALCFLLSCSEELASRSSPFLELKGLKVDIIDESRSQLFQMFPWESIECVKAYFLKNSPQAKFTTTDVDDFFVGMSKTTRLEWLWNSIWMGSHC